MRSLVVLAIAACGQPAMNVAGDGPDGPSFAIGGTVTGLSSAPLVLRDNGGDDLSLVADGPFTFASRLPAGASYAVSIASAPSGLSCAVTNGTGEASADVD